MPLYRAPKSGLPPGRVPGKILGVDEGGTEAWVDPPEGGKQLFRGAWAPASNSLVPQMSGNSSPAPVVITANSSYYSAHRAFDRNSTTQWQGQGTPSVASPFWLRVDLGLSKRVDQYSLTSHEGGRQFVDWTFQGSSDGASWTDLDVVTNGGLATGVASVFTVDNPDSYRHYRWLITKNGGQSWVSLREGQLINLLDAPYMGGEFVTHQGRMWESQADNNEAEPGTSSLWAERAELPGPSGATLDRPSPAALSPGYQYFDTDLNRPIYVNATKSGWVYSDGTAV